MGLKALAPEIELISQKAGDEAARNYQNWIGTPHLFLALSRFLRKNRDSDRFKDVYEDFTGILKEAGVTGEEFTEVFLELYPGVKISNAKAFKIQWHTEGNAVRNDLLREAKRQKRPMQVEDLIKTLFSDKSYILHDILLYVLKQDAAKVDALCEKMNETFNTVVSKQEVEELEKIPELTNLNKYVRKNMPIVIGADKAVNQIMVSLSGKSIRNAILIGLPGVGKTVAMYEFVRRIIQKETIRKFHGKIVYQLDAGALVAGTRYRGDMEAKLMNIVKILKANPEVLLFIDEAHMMVKLGDSDGAASAGNILKPFITRGEIQMIWATTTDEYQRHIQKDGALKRRFHEIRISEPTKEETYQILKGIQPNLEEYFDKTVSEEDMVLKILDFAEKYTLDEANPAKAINMFELAFANATVFNEDGEFVFTDDVRNAIKLKYDLHIAKDKVAETKEKLFEVLLGQKEPLEKMVEMLTTIDLGLFEKGKPVGSVILAGPTGVGKTETARIIAKTYFGSEKNIIKLNGGEYSTSMDITKITGSAPGYIGHDDETGIVSMIKQYPSSVVLIDEVEKMHPKVFDAFLNILDVGEMTDNHGARVSFKNALFIFTTNLGYANGSTNGRSTGFANVQISKKQVKETVIKHFRPEFINRLDGGIIVYNNLDERVADALIKRYRKEYIEQMDVVESKVRFGKKDIEHIKKVSKIDVFGARGLRRAVRNQMLEVLKRKELVGA